MEIWKNIKGFEGFYQVNNLGKVKTIERKRICSKGGIRLVKEKMLTPCIFPNGYIGFYLRVNGNRKTVLQHRIVAECFIENKNNLATVNHKDSNRSNNNIENLEWMSQSQNIKYGFINNAKARENVKYCRGKKHKRSIGVEAFKDQEKVLRFESINMAAKYLIETNITTSIYASAAGIRDCIHGKQKTAYKYTWRKTT